jgi:precorrin-6A synthase
VANVRKLFVIGIGTGNPEHLTVQAVKLLQTVDVVFVLDKGAGKADLAHVRRELCERYIEHERYRVVALADTPRDAGVESYSSRVEQWHDRRSGLYERALREHLPEDGRGAILVWGDPALYDSTLRILEGIVLKDSAAFAYEVVPGISSPQVLAARHKIPLNRIGGAVHVTTGRRLQQGLPECADDVVVMLDGDCAFQALSEPGLEIYWGAYLGTEHEILIAGPHASKKDEIVRVRAAAKAKHGWIMDTYLLRRPVDAGERR